MRMKRTFITISLVLPVLAAPFFAFAQVASGTIQLPSALTADILTQATALLSSLEGYMSLIIGVLLALVVVEFVISAIRHRGQ
jgi:hypothetical protein